MSSDEAFAVLREDSRRTASGIPWLPDRFRREPVDLPEADDLWPPGEPGPFDVDGFGYVEGPERL